ncbi:MAG: sulfurtransferase TusA family protein [Deltaproteobacteria bacterium]|nr:sulfurtransferase TusA family protein [Deltaproteobacteria bacterium]
MGGKIEQMNLCGVKCPLNWAKAKVRLEDLERGDMLELLIDDPKGRRDIPRAAEAEGYAIVSIHEVGSRWRIVIEK